PLGPDKLPERAAFQTRIDRKYVVPVAYVDALLAGLHAQARVLDIDGRRRFAYESVYFDTPELTSYLLAARRRRRRFKVRTRTYLDSCHCWLEVKTRGARGATVKHRLPYSPEERTNLQPGRQFVEEVLTTHRMPEATAAAFAPTLITRYHRTTLFIPSTASRITIDTDLTWDDTHRQLRLPDTAIVEVKSRTSGSGVDRLLWDDGFRPTRISKYATGMAALHPDLPAAPWRRTLRRYFTPASVSTPTSPSPTSRSDHRT
ncbi:MAG: molecular chaperone, partial [Actinobacteria bacterium]